MTIKQFYYSEDRVFVLTEDGRLLTALFYEGAIHPWLDITPKELND